MNKFAENYFDTIKKTLAERLDPEGFKSSFSNAINAAKGSATSVANSASSAGSSVKDQIKSAIKSFLNYKPNNFVNSLTSGLGTGLVAGGGAGALLGGAAGAITDPGYDEQGNRKSRLNRALGGAAVGGALGGTLGGAAGALSPLALRGGVKAYGEVEKALADKTPWYRPDVKAKGLVRDLAEGVTDKTNRTFGTNFNPNNIVGASTPSQIIDEATKARLEKMRDMSVGEIGGAVNSKAQSYLEAIARYLESK